LKLVIKQGQAGQEQDQVAACAPTASYREWFPGRRRGPKDLRGVGGRCRAPCSSTLPAACRPRREIAHAKLPAAYEKRDQRTGDVPACRRVQDLGRQGPPAPPRPTGGSRTTNRLVKHAHGASRRRATRRCGAVCSEAYKAQEIAGPTPRKNGEAGSPLFPSATLRRVTAISKDREKAAVRARPISQRMNFEVRCRKATTPPSAKKLSDMGQAGAAG